MLDHCSALEQLVFERRDQQVPSDPSEHHVFHANVLIATLGNLVLTYAVDNHLCDHLARLRLATVRVSEAW